MTQDNFTSVANLISENLSNERDYLQWLELGIDAVVMKGVHPTKAFIYAHYIIGGSNDSWEMDLSRIYKALPESQLQPHKSYFQKALSRCLAKSSGGKENISNDPSTNHRRNAEQVALSCLSLVRECHAVECLEEFDRLIRTNFKMSQAVYDATLLTWRVMVRSARPLDWAGLVFCPEVNGRVTDLRFRQEYAPMIAFGMCIIQPSRAEYFLNNWSPLKDYWVWLQEEQTSSNLKILERFRSAVHQLEKIHSIQSQYSISPREEYDALMTRVNEAFQQSCSQQRDMPRHKSSSIGAANLDLSFTSFDFVIDPKVSEHG